MALEMKMSCALNNSKTAFPLDSVMQSCRTLVLNSSILKVLFLTKQNHWDTKGENSQA